MAWLEIVTGEGSHSRYLWRQNELVVGRHPTCDIVLRDSTISRRHLRLYQRGGQFFAKDLESQHGTTINGQLLTEEYQLQDKDQIRIRGVRLNFHASTPPDSGLRLGDSLTADDPSSTILSSRSIVGEKTPSRESANSAQQLAALLEITDNLGASLDLQEIFPRVLESLFRIFPQANRGYVLLLDESSGKLVPRAIRQSEETEDEPSPISFSIAKRVMEEGQAILSGDASDDRRFQDSGSVQRLKLRSVMCAPLMSSSQQSLGMIQISTESRRLQFVEGDLDVLVNVANLAGMAVQHARLHQSQLEYERRESDVATARQLQLHFLPAERPVIEGYEFYDYYRAAEGVGGDYFGYIPLPDGRLAVAVGDVAGKGVTAALLMARLCSDVRYSLAANSTALQAAQDLNRQIAQRPSGGRFVTFALCILDAASHEVTVVNAGHMPPLMIREQTGEVIQLAVDVSGPPLGVADEWNLGESRHTLEPGDAIVMYTDGVNEATSTHAELYGEPRVIRTIATQRGRGAKSMVTALSQDVRDFAEGAAQHDDICIVGFSRGK